MNYTYRLYPTAEQQVLMRSWLETCRHLYNRCLRDLKDWIKLYHQIANTRKNFHLQTSHQLCDQLRSSGDSLADMIFVEDINFKMTAKGFLGKQMLDGGFGQFRDLLSWVCWKRGKYFAQVDHKYTSQICPECGTHTGKKELKERVHVCDECGYQTARDHASGRVILQRGLSNIVPVDCGERKLSGNGVLSGVLYLDKCRSRNANSRDLEARANPTDERRERSHDYRPDVYLFLLSQKLILANRISEV